MNAKARENYSMILARSENDAIGFKGKLPWHCDEDLKYFKKVTTGHICLTGYKTYLTLPKNGLPNRLLYVLSRKNLKNKDSVFFIKSLEYFLKLNFPKDKKIFCIGGLSVYKSFLPYATKIYLNEIKGQFAGDAFFDDKLLMGFNGTLLKETDLCKYYLYKRINGR